MSNSTSIKVALIGNPNTGKTLLFNQLTGLHQKVGNYPGVTVDKKEGTCKLSTNKIATIIDLPGTYSINPTSMDESVVLKLLQNTTDVHYPDCLVVISDIENLKRNLLLFLQIKDLEIPTILVINMIDLAKKKGITIHLEKLQALLETKIILVSAKSNKGIDDLKTAIIDYQSLKIKSNFKEIALKIDAPYFNELETKHSTFSLYQLWLMITQRHFEKLSKEEKKRLEPFEKDASKIKKYQYKETIYRYQKINKILNVSYLVDKTKATDLRSKLDKIFTHKFFGYLIFFGILLVIFQAIFNWALTPMDFIDTTFSNLSTFLKTKLPPGAFTDLLTDGIISGIGGIVIFIPQIAILFLFIAILEETGYINRVVFLMDKIMRKFGMSGKSIIPLISGTACAIPAIMATRTIADWKDRLITILVTPFTTCSARLPVYAIMIALVIPDKKILGFLNLQGLTLFSLYFLGFFTAVVSAYFLKRRLKIKSTSFFVVEMPDYKIPSLKNTLFYVIEKTKIFVLKAGQVILTISIILWFLASKGPTSSKEIRKMVTENPANKNISMKHLQEKIDSKKLEKSYIGILGKTIEPIVKPLGYDWKIGIGLITSFAAREVFVGTLATIYSVQNNDDTNKTIKQKMEQEINPNTGKKQFNFASGMSLLVFFSFSMQCMSTLAIVKRETKSWKWPLIQLFGMGFLAYISSFIVYQILS